MNTAGWTTHCFGRFLIDLPPQAQASASYEISGAQIRRVPDMTRAEIAPRLDARERELRLAPHRTRGAMLIRRVSLRNGSDGVLAWDLPYSTVTQKFETYLVAINGQAVYQRDPEIDPDRQGAALQYSDELSRSLYALEETPLPPRGTQAFCIDGAYLKGNDFRSESMRVTVRLPEHPGTVFTFSSITAGDVDETLMQRMDHFGSGILQRAVGIRTLRKGDRSVNGIKAQEYLVSAMEDGQRHYTFTFENLYKAESVAEPQLNAGMHVEGKPDHAPAFASDAEALALWDALIDSIRPLPGSRDAPPPAPREPPLSSESFEQRESNRHALDHFIATGEWLPPAKS